jgi:hypothetical protein
MKKNFEDEEMNDLPDINEYGSMSQLMANMSSRPRPQPVVPKVLS